AVANSTDGDLNELRRLYDDWLRLRRSIVGGEPASSSTALFEKDSQFHIRIVQLSRNPYLMSMYHRIDAHVWAFVRARLGRCYDAAQDATERGHYRILQGLTRRDGEAATEAIRAHIWEVYALYSDDKCRTEV